MSSARKPLLLTLLNLKRPLNPPPPVNNSGGNNINTSGNGNHNTGAEVSANAVMTAFAEKRRK